MSQLVVPRGGTKAAIIGASGLLAGRLPPNSQASRSGTARMPTFTFW
nr:hypothetical protein [Mycetohabitans endofungorum]